MRIPSLSAAAALMAVAASAVRAEEATTTAPIPACTAISSTSNGAFFDLRPDVAKAPATDKSTRRSITKDYHARGYDYGSNFTINICEPVVAPVKDVVGVSKALWGNVSAYYTHKDKVYSIGSSSLDLRSRGRKLVLRYGDGSPCEAASKPNKSARDQKPATGDKDKGKDTVRRKSTVISFLCDRDSGNAQAAFSFVGTDPDECAYFFEARSAHACAQAEPHRRGNVGPGSVFGLILVIAVLVYVIGGVCYNRTVAHARGWRQLPNYSLWAGIGSFVTVRSSAHPTKPGLPIHSRRGS
ncbi:Mannose-6-phosphate receptor, binding protein [Cordyceps fumosorosea ARSEF 2679]|uniref:Mannose-6-phosphate receptor, binding protein n=1 Tax=Cordyceps fumosorosea (strain ARSEF 2679) TaxID=1081104 RepID=A0A167P9L8_CORFA|nr:Mannose-6-phosphate receptor, binding protein [Cordyceps fumosorosea ARSEF 2679]OAA56431.1 Mannose-6-phosphate receptor, binding protein [Cordyceps fumosorosea ARSEF 2679]